MNVPSEAPAEVADESFPRRRVRSIDPFLLAIGLILTASIATWLLPAGAYDRKEVLVHGRRVTEVDWSTYHRVTSQPQVLSVFVSPFRGFVDKSEVIVFILFVVGAFTVFDKTGTLTAATAIVARAGRHAWLSHLVIPVVMGAFSLFGATVGMCEEAVPLAALAVPLALALGYDALVGISLTFVAAGIGFATGFANPLPLALGQELANVAAYSGQRERIVIWAVFTFASIAWVMVYAGRTKERLRRASDGSGLPPNPVSPRAAQPELQAPTFSWRHGICLVALVATITGVVLGATIYDWEVREMGGLFLALAVVAAVASGMGAKAAADAFVSGAKDMVRVALVIACTSAVLVLLKDGQVFDTVLHGMARISHRVPGFFSGPAMYILQSAVSAFIPSASSAGALTVPLLAELANSFSMSKQTAVLAYQLAAGFTAMIVPTSAVTMGTLAVAHVPYSRWIRWFLPFQGMLVGLSLLVLMIMSNRDW